MLQPRSPEKGKISLLALLMFSVLSSVLLSIFFRTLIEGYSASDSPGSVKLLTIFTFILCFLFATIFALLGVLLNRVTKERAYTRELKNFKDFTDALHRVSSEIEVYEILFNFLRNIPLISQTTLFYRSDRASENVVWQKISDEKIPLCNLSAKNCPLIRLGRECRVESIENDITCTYQSPKFKSGSYICLSIVDSGHPQGILQLYSKNENFFDAVTTSKVKSYIEIAKLVINSKRTLHNLNKKASTDKLTKLYNRGFLEPYLENQLEAANLSNQQLSLIMIDIDHFKKINDTYGHSAGDHVLVLFSEIVLNCVRKTDLVARYGGEEFIVILPSTDLDTTIQIAERIRQTVAATKIPTFDGMNIPSITCSLGISVYPDFCDSKITLLKTSDIALYKAKQSGRNMAVVYDKEMESCLSDVLLHA